MMMLGLTQNEISELTATVNLASNLKVAMRVCTDFPGLKSYFTSCCPEKIVMDFLGLILSEKINKDERDVLVLVSLLAIDQTQPHLARKAAYLALTVPDTWWTKRLASRILDIQQK